MNHAAALLLCALLVALMLTACSRDDGRAAALELELAQARDAIDDLELELALERSRVAQLKGSLDAAPAPVSAPDDSSELLREIAALRERIAQLEASPEPEPAVEQPAQGDVLPEPPPADGDALRRRLDQLLPAVQARGAGTELDELTGLALQGDKEFRDEVIERIRAWSQAEPESAKAKLALAQILTARFADLDGRFMEQGRLAAEVRREVDAALSIDPEFYDAVHFLAILKVNYPTFTNEFKTANVELDRALELQQQLPWEPRFAAIYAFYSLWYRKQDKLDEAEERVNAGLRLAPQAQSLLDEKAAVEAARSQGD
jgi:hypothetical protein